MALQFSVTPTNTQPTPQPVATSTPIVASSPISAPFGNTPSSGTTSNTSTSAVGTNGSYNPLSGYTAFANWFNPGLGGGSPLPVTPNGNIANPTPTPTTAQGDTGVSTSGSTTTSSPSNIQSQIDNLKNTTASDTGTTYNNSNGFTDAPYTVGTGNFDSNGLAGNTSYGDVLNRRQQMENQYMQAYQQQSNALAAQYKQQGLDQMNYQNALYSGDTTSYGQGAAAQAQRTSAFQDILAQGNLLGAQNQVQGMANMLGFQNQDIQNQLATVPNLQNVTQAADGSIVGFTRNPLTGQVTPQNFGNPALGTFSTSGTTGGSAGGSSGQSGGASGQITLPPNNDGTYRTPDGGSVNQQYASAISSLPSQLQSYIKAGPGGVAYFDASAAPAWVQSSGLLGNVEKAGIPVSTTGNDITGGIKAASQIYDLLNQEQSLITANLKSGLGGGIVDSVVSGLNNLTGGNLAPNLQGFNAMKQAAGKIDTSTLGGAGSGFRMNNIVLDTAINNLPTAGDSIQNAQAKLATLQAVMDAGMRSTFPSFQGQGSLTPSLSGASSSSKNGQITWDNLTN